MKKVSSLLIIITVIFSAVAFANSQEDILSFEEQHKDKDYIILLDETEVILNKDYTYTTRIHRIEKIQQEGGKSRGEITVYYNQAKDKLIEIEVFSITPNGNRYSFTDVQEFAVHEDRAYDDLREKVFTMPEVNIGSIIELKILKESKGEAYNQQLLGRS